LEPEPEAISLAAAGGDWRKVGRGEVGGGAKIREDARKTGRRKGAAGLLRAGASVFLVTKLGRKEGPLKDEVKGRRIAKRTKAEVVFIS